MPSKFASELLNKVSDSRSLSAHDCTPENLFYTKPDVQSCKFARGGNLTVEKYHAFAGSREGGRCAGRQAWQARRLPEGRPGKIGLMQLKIT